MPPRDNFWTRHDEVEHTAPVLPDPKPIQGPLPSSASNKFDWGEFVRVELDKLMLCGLVIFLTIEKADARITSAALGALAMSIQSRRFKWR